MNFNINNFCKYFVKLALDAKYGKIYIRFGRIPENEKSFLGLDDNWKEEMKMADYEEGVSVYNCDYDSMTNKFVIEKPHPDDAMYKVPFNYLDRMIEKKFIDSIQNNEIFLVSGNLLSDKGVDGEPLLKNIRIIKRLQPREIIYGGDNKSIDEVFNIGSDYYRIKKVIESVKNGSLKIDNNFYKKILEFYEVATDPLKIQNIIKKQIENLYSNINELHPIFKKIIPILKDIDDKISKINNSNKNAEKAFNNNEISQNLYDFIIDNAKSLIDREEDDKKNLIKKTSLELEKDLSRIKLSENDKNLLNKYWLQIRKLPKRISPLNEF